MLRRISVVLTPSRSATPSNPSLDLKKKWIKNYVKYFEQASELYLKYIRKNTAHFEINIADADRNRLFKYFEKNNNKHSEKLTDLLHIFDITLNEVHRMLKSIHSNFIKTQEYESYIQRISAHIET